MITINPTRIRPRDRVQSESKKPVTQQAVSLPAPTAGWVTNQNLAEGNPRAAYVLDNFWPTTIGIEPRGGSKQRVDIDATCTALFEFKSEAEFIATDETKIYTFTSATADGTTLTAAVTGRTSGDWQGTETQNDAGSFFTLVNGTDNLVLYDGTTWYTVTGVSATHSITGTGLTGTEVFSYVWNYRERQWFVETGTMNAWYLGVNSVSGTATKFPLAGVFNKGGTLHSGTTFSSDSGAGMDDRIIFLTDQGEIAVYSGDPASDISLIGVYDIGKPIARDPFIRLSGDILVATTVGLVPLTAAVYKDPAQLKASSASQPIEDTWSYWVGINATGWTLSKWDSRNMIIVGLPEADEQFALNTETGAWTRFTGWPVRVQEVLGDRPHFASGLQIYEGDTGGADDGTPFVCRMSGSFSTLGSPIMKQAKRIRGNFRALINFTPKFSVATDYETSFPDPPAASDGSSGTGAIWDAADWDTAEWGTAGNERGRVSQWHVVTGNGFAHAAQVQITSAQTAKLDCQLVGYDMTLVGGDV